MTTRDDKINCDRVNTEKTTKRSLSNFNLRSDFSKAVLLERGVGVDLELAWVWQLLKLLMMPLLFSWLC